LAVHCAALAPTLLESELFGHEKGAFTGAAARRRGRFEMADGGTLFLDEVSEIEPAVQVKLLRALEERRFERVGGDQTVEVDIRLIGATNRDLRAAVAEGKFREDLYFRLAVVDITLPPLRERRDDVPLLCEHFLKEFNAANGKRLGGFTADAAELLAAHDWPGNVRELRNTIEKAVVLAKGERLTARDIPAGIKEAARGFRGERGAARAGAPGAGASLAAAEKSMILAALKRNGGNRSRAARELGISRRTLHRKLNLYRGEEQPAAGGAADSQTAKRAAGAARTNRTG